MKTQALKKLINNSLLIRSITGLLFVSSIIISLLIHPLLFVLIMLIYSCIAVWEFFQMHFTAKKKQLIYLQIFLSVAFFFSISSKFIPIEIPFSRLLLVSAVNTVIVIIGLFFNKRFFSMHSLRCYISFFLLLLLPFFYMEQKRWIF